MKTALIIPLYNKTYGSIELSSTVEYFYIMVNSTVVSHLHIYVFTLNHFVVMRPRNKEMYDWGVNR